MGRTVSTPCRLSPRDASATLLTALLTVRGRTPKKAVEERLGTGSATVREGAAPTDAQVSGPGYWPSTERHWGATVPHAGRHHCPTNWTVALPVRRGTQQATEQLGGAMNQLSVPSASTAGGASGCFSARLECRGPSLESLRAALLAVVFRCPVLYCLTRIIGGISCRAIR